MNILGISCGHDASACLLVQGSIVADVAEERFSRIKHDASFPQQAIAYCLEEAGISSEEIDVVAIGGRFLPVAMERYLVLSPAQVAALAAMRPVEAKARQLLLRSTPGELPLYMKRFALAPACRLIGVEHHLSHAAAACFTRGRRDRCLILTLDGIGDDVAAAVWTGEGNDIHPIASWGREASLGWFYGNVTEALGWQHGDGEGVTMGLAPYGDARQVGDALDRFHPRFDDGVLSVPHDYGEASLVNEHGTWHWHLPDANPIQALAQERGAANVAARAQEIVEEQVLSLVRHWTGALQLPRLACAGGLFLNVKLNQRLWRDAGLEEFWIYPNPGDAGLSAGAALYAWHQLAQPATTMQLGHLYHGPAYGDEEVRAILEARGLAFRRVDDPALAAAQFLANDRIVGWFQGRMEAGPRALGNRSILMSANRAGNKDVLNSRVKFRQAFRPFCPAILFEKKEDYLQHAREEPFMITAFEVTPGKRDAVPAVVHADGTLRPQTVRRETNPRFHDLIRAFGDLTGEYLVLSTSFNVRNEPIACHPREAIRCFFDTGIDVLVIGNFVLEKPGAPVVQAVRGSP